MTPLIPIAGVAVLGLGALRYRAMIAQRAKEAANKIAPSLTPVPGYVPTNKPVPAVVPPMTPQRAEEVKPPVGKIIAIDPLVPERLNNAIDYAPMGPTEDPAFGKLRPAGYGREVFLTYQPGLYGPRVNEDQITQAFFYLGWAATTPDEMHAHAGDPDYDIAGRAKWFQEYCKRPAPSGVWDQTTITLLDDMVISQNQLYHNMNVKAGLKDMDFIQWENIVGANDPAGKWKINGEFGAECAAGQMRSLSTNRWPEGICFRTAVTSEMTPDELANVLATHIDTADVITADVNQIPFPIPGIPSGNIALIVTNPNNGKTRVIARSIDPRAYGQYSVPRSAITSVIGPG